MQRFQGNLTAPTGRFALIAARFNGLVVESLLGGALDGFARCGVTSDAIDVIHVPGSLEISVAASRLARSGQYLAIVALGAIIRGETSHYDVVVSESAKGLTQVALAHSVPVLNAILTTDTVEQALNRAGIKQGNKGFEAACAAVEMASLFAQLPS